MMARAKKVLITGGTGFIGRNLVGEVANSFSEVRLLVEPGHAETACSIAKCAGGNVFIFEGDIRDSLAVRKAIEGCEIVVHLAAILKDAGHTELIRSVNLGGTENVLRSAIESGVARFIFISSLSVHRYRDITAGTEEFPADASSPEYAVVKAECERLVKEESARYGMEWITIRPGLIPFGEGDYLFTHRILALMEKGVIPLVDGGRHLLCTVYVGNLVHGIRLAMESPVKNETFIITDQTLITWRSFFEAMAKELRMRGLRMSVSSSALRLISEISERLIARFAEPPVTRYMVDLLSHDLYFHSGRATELLKYKPIYTIDEGIKRAVKWYKGNVSP